MNTHLFFQSTTPSRYKMYARQFVEFRKTLNTAQETFSQEKIWPDQCDFVIYQMNPLKKTAAQIANSFKNPNSGPLACNRYPLVVSAHYFAEQVDILIKYVREYREVTNERTAKKSKQRLIASSLDSLEASLFDLMTELDKLMAKPRPT